MEIKLTSTSSLSIQFDDEGKVMIIRMKIDGMPLQSREIFGGCYPSPKDLLDGLRFYGFNVVEYPIPEDATEKLGLLPVSFLDGLLKLFQ